jgi:hypothetical protein
MVIATPPSHPGTIGTRKPRIPCLDRLLDDREPRLNEKAMPRYSELEIDHGHHPSCDEDPPELDHKPDKPLRMNPAVVGCRMRCEELFTTLVQASTGLVPSEDMQEEAAEEVKMTSK